MSTWQGAIVRVDDVERLVALAGRYRITLSAPAGPWLLIDAPPQLGRLGPPPFAWALSRELATCVIGFFLQTTDSTERIEQWENGELVRELEYLRDDEGWSARQGAPQSWERAYFFSDEEGTAPDQRWPSNLRDEITTEDIARYETARVSGSAEPVMDLLSGGSITRLCEFHGVDLKSPAGHYTPKRNWRVQGTVLAIALGFAGAIVLWLAAFLKILVGIILSFLSPGS